MIDTHCHLTDPRLLDQLEGVLWRARSAGVWPVVTIGTDLPDDRAAIELVARHAGVYCAIGVHPNHVTEAALEQLGELEALQLPPGVVALGEMGLDFHHHFAPVELQRRAFVRQLELARKTRRPVVLHTREAVMQCLDILRDFPDVPGVFHSFTGTVEQATAVVDAGYLLGFTGPITFKKSEALREVVSMVPLDRMLVETDAPYLSPEPMRRQKVTEPALVVHVAETIARVKAVSVGEVDAITTRNARAFYRLPAVGAG